MLKMFFLHFCKCFILCATMPTILGLCRQKHQHRLKLILCGGSLVVFFVATFPECWCGVHAQEVRRGAAKIASMRVCLKCWRCGRLETNLFALARSGEIADASLVWKERTAGELSSRLTAAMLLCEQQMTLAVISLLCYDRSNCFPELFDLSHFSLSFIFFRLLLRQTFTFVYLRY